mgnify:CR=1 FL=1
MYVVLYFYGENGLWKWNFFWVTVNFASQEIKLNWQIVVGSIVGFFGAAFGSVGGVGGGGIFVPMLTLIIGFDPKSATAISKCKRTCIFVLVYFLKGWIILTITITKP